MVISGQSLDIEETQALVQALESAVESDGLGGWEEDGEQWTLDIAALTQYSGQGKCRVVRCGVKFREQFRTWAEGKDWRMFVISDLNDFVMMKN